jgi:hypothetical protein
MWQQKENALFMHCLPLLHRMLFLHVYFIICDDATGNVNYWRDFKALTALLLKIQLFFDKTPSSLVSNYLRVTA